VLAGGAPLDPARPGHVIAPAYADVTLSMFTGGRWARHPLSDEGLVVTETGAASIPLVGQYTDEGRDLFAWSARYRLTLRGQPPLELTSLAVPAGVRRAGVVFERSINRAGRRAYKAGVGSANRHARRLIDLVDGLITVGAHSKNGYSMAHPGPMRISYNRGHLTASRRERRMTILHELGHLIDAAMVDDSTFAKLERMVPRGGRCNPNRPTLIPTGPCAVPAERFADTFAKWAMNDRGIGLRAGYNVKPPKSLKAWGRVLLRGVHLRPAGNRL
jgi:hypothetical protein